MEETLERFPKKSKTGKWIVLGVIVVVLFFVSQTCFVVTEQNEYKLIKQFGKVEQIISEPGISFKIPFIQTVDTLPKEMLLYDLQPSDVITMDKKTMVCDSYVFWRISDPQVFIQTLNSKTYAEDRINTTVYNAVKNVISSMQQTEVISGRDGALSQRIRENIGNSMEQYGIDLISVETKHLDLPSDNKSAVYERMISERNNIAAQYTAEGEAEATKIRTQTDNEITVSLSEAEAQAEKIIAEGEAEYMRILSGVYADESRSEFYTFVRALDAAKQSLTGKNKTVILSEDSPMAQIFNFLQ
ncbi:MAG: protease modulator HflC [Lachnospiraceae bacterium]|nr:protease modulator HflC [Lachnospiraceae bacterium]